MKIFCQFPRKTNLENLEKLHLNNFKDDFLNI